MTRRAEPGEARAGAEAEKRAHGARSTRPLGLALVGPEHGGVAAVVSDPCWAWGTLTGYKLWWDQNPHTAGGDLTEGSCCGSRQAAGQVRRDFHMIQRFHPREKKVHVRAAHTPVSTAAGFMRAKR